MPRKLTEEQIAAYQRDGFLAFDRLLPESEVDALVARLQELVESPPTGLRIQVEPRVQRGEAQAPSYFESIRKVEGLVENDELFLRLARHPEILPRVQDLLGEELLMFRDALMMKPPKIGSEKPYHQDSAYWRIEPMDLCSIWVALDDATLENGCMRIIPGSHLWGLLEHKRIRDFQVDESTLDRSGEVAVPLHRGGVLFFHSLVLHATDDNLSDRPRKAMIVSYMRASSRWTGPPQAEPNWLMLAPEVRRVRSV
ncbi:MAG: L-proline 4-hydroxylase [Candidatus Poribacteria bacterium]|nr:MAG: L-proline 4-hydroxylase [Candidatus Poribacteria bacterium]